MWGVGCAALVACFPKGPKYLYGGDTYPNHSSTFYYRNPYLVLCRYLGSFGFVVLPACGLSDLGGLKVGALWSGVLRVGGIRVQLRS